jgi:pyruvate-formate lyase-activating enzyme
MATESSVVSASAQVDAPAPMERRTATRLRPSRFAAQQPPSSFQLFQCRARDLERVFARSGGYGAIGAELLPMAQLLSRRPAGTFADLIQLKIEACGAGADPTPATIRAFRDLFLEIPNEHLQQLYRAHFVACPPAANTSHQDRIAALENVRSAADAVVASFDWPWLAGWLRLDRIGGTDAGCVRRLSNLAFAVKRVNFRFTYHCNIECRHCYNGSGPNGKRERIGLESMLGIIAQMPEADIPALNLTGGEPFLYTDDLTTLIAAGRAAGLNEISIYTNGFWATTAEKTRQMLNRLAAAGFMHGRRDHLKVSTGVYHQEFITLDRVALLGRCFHETFGRRLVVDFELPPGSREPSEEVRRSLNVDGLGRCITVSFREAQPLGRGRSLPGTVLRQIDSPCRSIDQLSFDPDGSVRPCCGLNNENLGVKIGATKDHGLRDLVKRMQNDPILQTLGYRPMSAIFDHVQIKQNAMGYAGQCDLCQHALGQLADKEQLQAALFDRQEFYPFWFSSGSAGHRPLAAEFDDTPFQSDLD